MLDKQLRQTIFNLHERGQSNREVARLLKISRNTVRAVLMEGVELPEARKEARALEIVPIVRELFTRCRNNAVRVQEILKDEYSTDIAYSTLTRLIKEQEIREPIKRTGEYCFEPGVEMQHDTSPHWVILGEKKIKAQCASLVFGYSRKIFMQYYPCFTRFEAKTFLKSAFEFMQGTCKRCVIDNTSVVLSGGSGSDAVISPEMSVFSRMFDFEFIAHRILHANRKGKIERPFYYIETNFLAGRTFRSWEDLNFEAKDWCIKVNQKDKRVLGMSPEVVFIKEKSFLNPLPKVLPPIYEHYQRIVDSSCFINLDSNRYSVPEKLIGRTVDVYKHPAEVHIFFEHKEVAIHPRLAGQRQGKSCLPGHHAKFFTRQADRMLNEIEKTLKEDSEILDSYITKLKKHVRGSGRRQLNRLLDFRRTYPKDAFLKAIARSEQYGLFDLNRLEELIIKFVAGDYFTLNQEDEL